MNKQEKILKKLATIVWIGDMSCCLSAPTQRHIDLAKEGLKDLKSQGAVLKLEKELPELKKLGGEAALKEKMAYLSGVEDYRDMLKKAGWCAYEELI